jgi:hypothetical protein
MVYTMLSGQSSLQNAPDPRETPGRIANRKRVADDNLIFRLIHHNRSCGGPRTREKIGTELDPQ